MLHRSTEFTFSISVVYSQIIHQETLYNSKASFHFQAYLFHNLFQKTVWMMCEMRTFSQFHAALIKDGSRGKKCLLVWCQLWAGVPINTGTTEAPARHECGNRCGEM